MLFKFIDRFIDTIYSFILPYWCATKTIEYCGKFVISVTFRKSKKYDIYVERFYKKVALHAVMIEPNKIKYKVKIFPI